MKLSYVIFAKTMRGQSLDDLLVIASHIHNKSEKTLPRITYTTLKSPWSLQKDDYEMKMHLMYRMTEDGKYTPELLMGTTTTHYYS